LCVGFERKNGKVYYLACTNTKLPYKKVLGRYLKRTGIEVMIRVLKQEMGIGKRLVRKGGGDEELGGTLHGGIYVVFG